MHRVAYWRGLDQASQLLGIDDAATFAAISSMRKSRSVEITGTRIGKEFIYPYTEHNRHLAQICVRMGPKSTPSGSSPECHPDVANLRKGPEVTAQSKLLPIVGIVLFCVLMGTGQMLFKLASIRAKGASNLLEMLHTISVSPFFWTAGILYAVASMLWVIILTRVPLSVAYPATTLTIVLVPLASWLFFGDALSMRLAIGMAAILFGVWLIAGR